MLSLYILAVITAIVGFFIGRNFRGKNEVNWQEQFETSEKEVANLNKQLKKEKKKIKQLEQQNDSLKSKFETAEATYIPMVEELNKKIETATNDAATQQGVYEKLNSANTRLFHQFDQTKKDHQKLQEKYKTDLSDSKGWKNKRDALTTEIDGWKRKFLFSQKEVKELKVKLEAQNAKIEEVNKFGKEFRVMKADKRKLTKDLKYWEQKHYDIHHELASLKTQMETMQQDNKELDLRFKGSEIEKKNMMKKIEEFKTKFVNVNNLYHELKSQKN